MGNSPTKSKELKNSSSTSSSSASSSSKITPQVEKTFRNLVGNSGDHLTIEHLKKVFNEGLAEDLWKFLSDSKPFDGRLTLAEFARHVDRLWGTSTDIYVLICQPILHLIKQCAEAAGAPAMAGDEQFISNLARNMSENCSSVEKVISWKNSVCPAFCNGLQAQVLHILLGQEHPVADYSSDILTPIQMWYIQCCLPSVFFPSAKVAEVAIHGISVNRFEHNVFDYKGPTVSVFQLTDKKVFVLSTEETWRHSASRYGGTMTKLFEVSPELMVWSPSSPIYSNFRIRSAAFGISFSDVLKIDKELGNVASVEVWGCASSNALEDQQRLRIWQNKQAEKNRKVPLPGNWDDNPDKTILEMGGFQFSDERKRMEMEKMARDLS
ncbi:hypothetical protein KIN20_027657 [Parelaphostrongylus tenuis]|uniref:TLDc domain-containing protein n=1 Tax=Parelaphostrongylus tenuis TaxID=148309 RepID=A0AAD5WDZ5_PARTN|nr:hypothetical protein KIN20_027657 [Parelaphostrongylus tenuis]